MTFARLVDTSRRVAETPGRRAKIALLADLLRALPAEELEIGVAYLSGTVLQAKLGVGWATIQAALPGTAADAASVSLTEMDETLSRIMQASGPGSAAGPRARAARSARRGAPRAVPRADGAPAATIPRPASDSRVPGEGAGAVESRHASGGRRHEP